MATNAMPKQLDQVETLAEDMADGLHDHEVAVKVKQNTEEAVRADLDAAKTAGTNYDAKVSASKALNTAATVADSNGKAFIGTAKRVLVTFLGSRWTQAWSATGFPNNSTAIPSTTGERQALLWSLKNYFTANAAHENAPLNVTAERAETLFNALKDARNAVNNGNAAAGEAKATRDTAFETLQRRMRGLIDELGQLLLPDDPRWYAFGLSRPSDPETPGVPDGLVLTAGTPGSIIADWGKSRRADRYRVFKQEVGTDADFVHVTTETDSDVTLNGFASGATVKVRVTAANEAGESQPSAEAQIVVP